VCKSCGELQLQLQLQLTRRNKGVWSSLGSWSLYSTILVILLVILGETLGDILGDTLGDILMARV
jgi:hypothetical protein